MKQVKGGVTAAKGFEAASTAAGIKYKDRTDMASKQMLIRLTEMVMELSDTYLQSVTSDTMIPSHVHVVFVRHLEQELRMVTKLLPSRQEQT